MSKGDLLELSTPGGGGFGPPEERRRESVLRDVRGGLVSPDCARGPYGVEVDVLAGTVEP